MPACLHRPFVLLMLGLSFALVGCGKKSGLDTPETFEQATPFTPEGRAAIEPARDEKGKIIRVPTKPRKTPSSSSFPLDPLID